MSADASGTGGGALLSVEGIAADGVAEMQLVSDGGQLVATAPVNANVFRFEGCDRARCNAREASRRRSRRPRGLVRAGLVSPALNALAWASVRECHLMGRADAAIWASCRGARHEVALCGASPDTVSSRRVLPCLMLLAALDPGSKHDWVRNALGEPS
jgi:hypothetical protein